MSSIPVGTVECRDPKVCGGARFHYASTASACGATKSPMRAPANFAAHPLSQKNDPSCPVHGIETGGEYAVANLTRGQVRAGALGVSAILGLCSCSSNTEAVDPTISGGATTQVEQTISPSPSAAAVDISNPAAVPAGEWPAESADYTFSEEPQGVQEQWLAQNYPDAWAQGVRAVTTDSWMVPSDPRDDGKGTPGALVQYVGGERYEGTVDLPLRFQPAVTDGDTLSSVNTDVNVQMSKNNFTPTPTPMPPGLDYGFNSYGVSISERDAKYARNSDVDRNYRTSVQITSGGKVIGDEILFDTADEALAWVMGGVTPEISGDARVINPGEISVVSWMGEDANGNFRAKIFDSRIGDWIVIK